MKQLYGSQVISPHALSPELSSRLFDGDACPDVCSTWQAVTALYDSDTLLPLLTHGLRLEDVAAALKGGVSALNCSIDWHDVLEPDDIKFLTTLARQARLPAIRLLLTVSVDRDTAGFAAWFQGASARAAESGFPMACKLYGREPHFRRNLDAVWRAGWRAVIFTQDRVLMAEIARAGGDVLFRHANSPEDVDAMRTGGRGVLVATSPHYLVPVGSRQRNLPVRPPLPEDDARDRFVSRCLSHIDVIATDHVASGATTGPGLASQHRFLPALLHLAETSDIDPGTLLAKAVTAPAEVFGGHPAPQSLAIVARRPQGRPSEGPTARDPFAETPFANVVVAIVTNDTVARTPAFHAIVQGAAS